MDAVRSVGREGMKMYWATKTMQSVVLVLTVVLMNGYAAHAQSEGDLLVGSANTGARLIC